MKIGFFDSGLGGLTILRETVKELPQYSYYYYGDTKNLPYGDKEESEIYELSKVGMRYLFDKEVSLAIIACNTASAETARKLQREFLPQEYPDRKILGIIVPTVEEIISTVDETGCGDKRVLLLATKRTVSSDKYKIELAKKCSKEIDLQTVATPQLVPFIEAGEIDLAAQEAIKIIADKAGDSQIVVLGCSHYAQLKKQLRERFGTEKTILSQDEIIPQKLRSYLDNHPEIEQKLDKKTQTRTIHLTKHRPDYDLLMGQFLNGTYVPNQDSA